MKILGIDPSYKRMGFAVIEDTKLLYSTSLAFTKNITKKAKRVLIKIYIKDIELSFSPDKIVVERTRLYSHGFISSKTIIALGSLTTAIIDATDLDIFSVDSRAFKSKIVGDGNCSKQDAIDWVKSKFNISVDEDEADAILIASYPFVKSPLLRKENN